MFFSWGIAVLPDSSQEKVVAKLIPETWKTEKPLSDNNKEGKRYFRLTEYFFDKRYYVDENDREQTKGGIFNRNLILREQLLIASELNSRRRSRYHQ